MKRFNSPVKNPRTAMALSLIPGLGQIYNSQARKGIFFFIVGSINLTTLLLLCFCSYITNQIVEFGQLYNVNPNENLVSLFSNLSLSSPSTAMLLTLFTAFLIFSMRDAYDSAVREKRKAIYSDSLLDLSEAGSASYLLHISAMISFLVLAFFFLIPPKERPQITLIEFVVPKEKVKEPVVTENTSEQKSKPKRVPRKANNKPVGTVKNRPAKATKPAQKTQSKPTFTPKPIPSRPLNRSTRPSPVSPKLTSATPVNQQVPKLTTVETKPDSNNLMKNLLAFNPMKANTSAPSPNPVLNLAKTNSGVAPQPVNSNSRGSQAGSTHTPQVISNIGNTQKGRSNSAKTELAPIGRSKNKLGSRSGPAPAPSKSSNDRGQGIKDLISIKPSVGAPKPASRSNGLDGSPTNGELADAPVDPARHVDFTEYMRKLQQRIKRNWFPPKDLRSKRVKVIFSINTDGSIGTVKLLKAS